ncbi:MAG: hypothetical protein ACUVR2_11675 [Anaerolineae bacterium]
MTRKILIASVALLLILAFAASVAMGQGGGSMSTAFAVQNLGTSQAVVQVEFRDTNGNVKNTLSQTVNVGANYNFDQRYSSGNPGADPFQGSAIVSSDQPIGAAANMMRTGGVVPSYESYNALDPSGIGRDIMLPQILKNVSSAGLVWNTTIVIQNTDTSNAATVDLVFTPDPTINPAIGGTLTSTYTHTVNIPAGGTVYLDQSTTPNDTQIGNKFFGSVRVLADRDVAPIVYSDGGGRVLLAYPSYAAGTTDDIVLPSIYKNIVSLGESYSTAILIVNFGSSDATVEIEYLPASSSYTVSGKDTVTVPAKGALNVDQRYNAPSITSGTFMGGAVIKSTNGQPIAAMVNLRGGSRYGMTYGGLMRGGTTAYLPIAYKTISSAGYSWSSTIIVYNFDRATGDATVNFTFYPISGGTIADPNNYTVSNISQFDLRFTTAVAANPSFIGSVKVTSVGSTPRNIGVMIQTRGAGGSGDALMAFLGLMP